VITAELEDRGWKASAHGMENPSDL
jgi:hypothetical protein